MKTSPHICERSPLVFPDVRLETERRRDGSILLRNQLMPPPTTTTLPERLAHWAARTPERVFLSQEEATSRHYLSYAAAQEKVTWIAARLLSLPISAERPLMLVGANSIEQALLMLAAMTVGLPVAVVSPAYAALAASPWTKFQGVVGKVTPGVIIADDPPAARLALSGSPRAAVAVLPMRTCEWLAETLPLHRDVVQAAACRQDLDAAAKLLFTSGSTGSPKAVVNTQRMMVSNVQAIGEAWPFLKATPPVLVDWLPWNHTFGGNFCFNLALWYGGALHIDAGRPTPAAIGRTVAALHATPPTAYFNVPAGFDALLPVLEEDRAFAARFFERLDFLFNAGAGLPASLRERLDAVSMRARGRPLPILGAWGATETAPCSTIICFETRLAANLGVPLPGVEIKLVPLHDRTELRVRGPNVTPGYWRDPAATAAAFDEEGFYRTGDAGRLAEPDAPEAGLLFGGRIAENFKLLSGTWVNAGEVRLAAIAATMPLVSDAVVTGEGRHELGLLVFVNDEACRRFLAEAGHKPEGEAAAHPLIRRAIADGLAGMNAGRTGSSTRVSRFAIMAEPPNAAAGEITDKGYLNQRAVLERRSALVEALYASATTDAVEA